MGDVNFSVIVNQVGYLPNAVKYVVVQSEEPLGTVNGNFQVLDGSKLVYSGTLTYRGPGITRPLQSDEDIPYFEFDKPRYHHEPWLPNNYWFILTVNELVK